jgi:hypothetical protein
MTHDRSSLQLLALSTAALDPGCRKKARVYELAISKEAAGRGYAKLIVE